MKHFKLLINTLLAVIVVGLIGLYIANNWQEFSTIRLVNPYMLIASGLLVLLSLYSAGMVNELTMEPHGIRPTKREVFGLAAITRFLNQIAPNYVGASVRAVYFKKKHDISYMKFSSSFAIANLMQVIISAVIAVCAYIIYTGSLDVSKVGIIIVIATILLAALFAPIKPFLRIFNSLHLRYHYRVFERLKALASEYKKVRSFPKLFVRMIFWMVLLTIISGVLILSLFGSFGVSVGFDAATFIAAMTAVSIVISITPAGLGIREGILVFAASLVGVPIVTSLAVSILFRAVTFAVAGVCSLALFKKLW